MIYYPQVYQVPPSAYTLAPSPQITKLTPAEFTLRPHVVTERELVAKRALIAGTATQVREPQGAAPGDATISGAGVPGIPGCGAVAIILPDHAEVTRRRTPPNLW